MPGLPVPHYPPDMMLSEMPGSPVRKHMAARTNRRPIPSKVEDFLDKDQRDGGAIHGLSGSGRCSNVCTGPYDVCRWAVLDVRKDPSLDSNEHGEGGERFAQLILSGLAEACIDTIEHGIECERKPVRTAKILLDTVAEMNEHWYKILLLRTDRGGGKGPLLVSMSLLKSGLAAIRMIGQREGNTTTSSDPDDPQLLVNATRLMARCLSSPSGASGAELDRATIASGIFPDTWECLACDVRAEYESDTAAKCVASRYISKRALERILAVPSEADRALLRWMMSPTVYSALGGWIETGTQMRSPEVAVRAPSWKAVRALLALGHRASLGLLPPDDADRQTSAVAARLLACRVEQRDGSLTSIPNVRPPPIEEDPLRSVVERLKPPSCAACGKSSGSLRRCTGCKTAHYCNTVCQRAHRGAHKRECKEIERKMGERIWFVNMMKALGSL